MYVIIFYDINLSFSSTLVDYVTAPSLQCDVSRTAVMLLAPL